MLIEEEKLIPRLQLNYQSLGYVESFGKFVEKIEKDKKRSKATYFHGIKILINVCKHNMWSRVRSLKILPLFFQFHQICDKNSYGLLKSLRINNVYIIRNIYFISVKNQLQQYIYIS